MKGTAFAFITLVVGSLGSPTIFLSRVHQPLNEERLVTGQIVQAIENLSKQIKDAGLDPLNIDEAFNYELPVPVILSVDALVDNFVFTGLSNIVVDSINFSILTNRLTFNIVLPNLSLSVGSSTLDVVLFGEDYNSSFGGSLNINQIRFIGDIRINIGIISGISIRSLSLQFRLGGIQSNLNLNILGNDLSSRVNTLLGTKIPATLTKFQSDVDKLLETVLREVIENALS